MKAKKQEVEEQEVEEMDISQYVKLMTMTLYDVQELRKATGNRIDDFERRGGLGHKAMAAELRKLVAETLIKLEKGMELRVSDAVAPMPVMRWFEQVAGIGPRYSGSLAAIVMDISRFRTISSLWAYCGMHLVPICLECGKIAYQGQQRIRFCTRQADRRWRIYTTSRKYQEDSKKGKAENEEDFQEKWYEHTDGQLCQHPDGESEMRAPQRRYFKGLLLDHNPFAKMTCWKIAGQFVRQGKFYRRQYEKQKAKYEARDKGLISDGQLDLRARRAMVKLFLSHMWEMWRKSEGLPAGKPWLMEKRGMDFHTHDYIPPPYAETFADVPLVTEEQ